MGRSGGRQGREGEREAVWRASGEESVALHDAPVYLSSF